MAIDGRVILRSQEYPQELIDSVAALSRLVTADETLESTVARIAELSVLAIEGADDCGISLVTNGHIETIAATSEVGHRIDALQLETGQGPCLSSIEKQATFHIPDLSKDQTWPRFSERAAQVIGVSSLLGFVLKVGEGSLGAMNVMSRQTDVFDDAAIAAGAVFAAQAGVALANALTHRQNQRKVGQLEEGIRTRQVIGEAVGIVMATQRVPSEKAFEILKTISQNTNVKLRVVAAGLVERIDDL
ncbi:MAG: GAF and ANTAR domain-containing protein [Actinomycetota bacterium]|nr:GAF and ANTAR domain-containing protein [Actinomycetota bacterium]